MKKNIAKSVFIITFMLLIPSFAAAVEFGGIVNNNSKLKTNSNAEFKFDQVNNASLWVKAPVIKNQNNEAYFTAQATYSFERDFNTAASNQFLDLDLCKFVYKTNAGASQLEVSAGRFITYDLTGLIFSQKADGLTFSVKNKFVEFNVYSAYTGLLNAKVDTMLSAELSKLSGDDKAIYTLAEKNLVGIAYVKFPYLFLQQNLALQGMGSIGFETKYNRYYVTANLSGPIAPIVYYNLNSTIGLTKNGTEELQTANLTTVSLSVYPPVYNSTVSINGVYASGNQGNMKAFRSITSNTAYEALNQPEYSGIVKTGLSFSLKPVSSLYCSGSCDLIFDAVAGTEKNEIKYKGIQFAAGLDYQIVSDFMIGAKYSQYSDKENKELSKKQIAVNACLKF